MSTGKNPTRTCPAGGRGRGRRARRRTEGQSAVGMPVGRPVLHDVRRRRVPGTGTSHGAPDSRCVGTADGHRRGRRHAVADGRAGRRCRQGRAQVPEEVRHRSRSVIYFLFIGMDI